MILEDVDTYFHKPVAREPAFIHKLINVIGEASVPSEFGALILLDAKWGTVQPSQF